MFCGFFVPLLFFSSQCYDPDTSSESKDDWVCRCPAPSVGSSTAGPATCKFIGECQEPSISEVCTNAEQTCIDTDVAHVDTWVCSCVAPYTGLNGLMGPAKCGIDECRAECSHCEMGVCSDADQDCYDPDVTVESDWVCRCKGSGEESVAAAAVCTGIVCATQDNEQCVEAPECVYDSFYGICSPVPFNGTNGTEMGAPVLDGDDDDCTFWECWWWLLLLLLLCCCLLLAFLLFRCRQKQQQNDMDDDKWNKQFQANVDEDDAAYGMVCLQLPTPPSRSPPLPQPLPIQSTLTKPSLGHINLLCPQRFAPLFYRQRFSPTFILLLPLF